MVTNYAKCRVKLRIVRAKFQFDLIVFCNRAVLLFTFLLKKQWILTKAITVKANFITQTKRIKRTTLRKLNQASLHLQVFLNSFSYLLKIELRNKYKFHSPALVGPYWEKLCPLSRVRPSVCALGPYSRPRAQFFPIRTDQGR